MFGAPAIPGSRQGCFKCGNLGHVAVNCQAPARLCYNCREPGHESTACPKPRSTDGRQCYACGGVGHVKTQCVSAFRGVRGGRGGFGPRGGFAGRGAFGGGFGARPRPTTNPDGSPITCYRCKGENHLARDCLAPVPEASTLANKTCYTCQETGHIARDCPKQDVAVASE
ncbi:hypothetical protein IAR50_002700 [Cryptococcus sp. DSM 104548]